MKRTLNASYGLTLAVVAASLLAAAPARAVPIAIVDSGTDLSHPDLVNHQWVNIYDWEDGVDNDDNGYIDDVHGWNFADGTNKLYNAKLLGTFPKDVYKFFDVQTRVLHGTQTDDDKAWYASKKGDTQFITQLEAFGNWVHGTHVAGISSRDASGAQIMPLKIIGGSSSVLLQQQLLTGMHAMDADPSTKDKLIKLALEAVGSAQGTALSAIGKYANTEGARVANCSFGSSSTQIKQLITPIIEKVLGHKLTDDEANTWAVYFLNAASDSMKKQFIDVAPNTLFVIAAGNDGTNNDLMPAVPANVKAPNTITVAATMGVGSLASFSNYGVQNVDIAAPGVGILSSIPGGEHLTLSGTSQATPFVTNIVGRMMDMAPTMTMAEIKEVLFQTVDRKDFLTGKVASGGIANPARAVRAAELMVTRHALIADAISQARTEVPDMVDPTTFSVRSEMLYVTPLMPLL